MEQQRASNSFTVDQITIILSGLELYDRTIPEAHQHKKTISKLTQRLQRTRDRLANIPAETQPQAQPQARP